MADDITDKQIIKFCNEKIRSLANTFWEAHFRAQAVLEDYKVGSIEELLAKTPDDALVADGSESDGRTRLSAQDIRNVRAVLLKFGDFMAEEVQTNITRLDAIAKSHTNTL